MVLVDTLMWSNKSSITSIIITIKYGEVVTFLHKRKYEAKKMYLYNDAPITCSKCILHTQVQINDIFFWISKYS